MPRPLTSEQYQWPEINSVPVRHARAMEGHLSAVAVGSARTELSANIRLMTRFFEQGVPADDDTCVRMMRSLPECGLGEIRLDISTEFCVELSLLAAGVARDYDENGLDDPDVVHAFPACDAYGEDEKALRADFYGKVGNGIREVGTIRCRATLAGFRQFIRDVRSAARALRDSGLCPRCPERTTARMRLPHASYCGECCFAVAILGDRQ